ncbi:hypothetical protein Ahy_A03g014865 isoform A [Arachis hypogaea]|uniref:Uncharacterized protein n=1 Tax=Arachis hypogaea TaxID=3818 RepID=A0A445DZ41_ARAHY|nr:hypothetical protein Ahy_A03g014865 isoform A [Arachis hypogaea]
MPSCDDSETLLLHKNLKEKQNKIRKRGCSSSSSSSLVRRRRYRFKRAILVAKKGVMATHQHQHDEDHIHGALDSCECGESSRDLSSVSARKLAATLWEINDFPPPPPPSSRVKKKGFDDEIVEQMRSCKEAVRGREKKAVSLSRSELLRQLSDPSRSPNSERMIRFEGDCFKRRLSALSYQHQSGDYYLDTHRSASLIEVKYEAENKLRNKKNCEKHTIAVKNRLKEARSGLSTSKKLLKVLNQMCLRQQHSSSMPLILALGGELDRVCCQIDQLIHEQRANQDDVEYVVKCFAEEKASWKRREREKIHDAIRNVAEELEVEKKLRRQTERLNKKIAGEMANAKASYLKVSKELVREKRAKEILEQICDELARGMGDDRAEVEELKRESAKVREEVEKEREMLQVADVLREERVQMKLSEAKYQFEEKNAVLEKLRNELEGFMKTKEETNGKDLELYFNKICGGYHDKGKENEEENVPDDDDDDSDLHSIELNMDNENRGYNWSYARRNASKDDSRRNSTEKESSIGRKSCSEKIQWRSICFNKGKSDCGIESSDHFDPEKRSIEFLSRDQIQDDNGEDHETDESFRSIKSLQDSMSRVNHVPLTLNYSDGREAEENAIIALDLEGDILEQTVEGIKSGS